MSVNNFHVFQKNFLPLPKKKKQEVLFGSACYVLGPGNVQVEFRVMYWTIFPHAQINPDGTADGYKVIVS